MSQASLQLPTEQDMAQAKQSSLTLSKYADVARVHLSIKSGNDEGDELILSGQVMQLLLDILAEMAQGNAVSVMPIHAELSTQEAANLLNVSRPYLVKLLEQNALPYRKIGTHRRVLAKDLIDYKQKIDAQRHQALDALTALSQELDMGY